MSDNVFEQDYFLGQYGGKYRLRNPPYKWRAFLKVIRRFRQTGALLDIGCALGLFLQQARQFYRCSGCDVSHYAIEQARTLLAPDVTFFQGELGKLPTSEQYDIITCFDVLEHIPDLESAWQNLGELLRPGGLLVLTVPVYDGPLGCLVKRLDDDPTHVHRRERLFWHQQVSQRFCILETLGIWRYFLLDRFYLNLVSPLARHAATAIMLVGEKTPSL
jgi:SAM-dependent methyltransferase